MGGLFNLFRSRKKQPQTRALTRDDLQPVLQPFRRSTWFPLTEQRSTAVKASKFSGRPALLAEEEWPCCGSCKQPLQLFLQLNADDLPEAASKPFGDGILQVFFCTNDDAGCETWAPFLDTSLLRVLDTEAVTDEVRPFPPGFESFPEKTIVAWQEKDDYPNWEELENRGVTLSDAQTDLVCDLDYPRAEDKLLGWPYWVQGVEYPDCPDCGKPMEFLFQIDSEDNLPYMFGDSGCSHVTRCAEHPNRMAIAWACC